MTASVVTRSVAGRPSSGRVERVDRLSPEAFWALAAVEIDWVAPWERVLDDSRALFYRWLRGHCSSIKQAATD